MVRRDEKGRDLRIDLAIVINISECFEGHEVFGLVGNTSAL